MKEPAPDQFHKPFSPRTLAGIWQSEVYLLWISAFFATLLIFLTVQHYCYKRLRLPMEQAALAASREMTRIVVEDPKFGYVGLFDAIPLTAYRSGKKTAVKPVRSVNTLLAASRLELLLADRLGSSVLRREAEENFKATFEAARKLETQMERSLKDTDSDTFLDQYGEPVHPYTCGLEAFKNSLKSCPAEVQSYYARRDLPIFTLGWSEGAGRTLTRVPHPIREAGLNSSKVWNGFYRPGINASYGGNDFYFSGAGEESKFIPVQTFRKADGKHSSSLVLACIGDNGKGAEATTGACVQPEIPPLPLTSSTLMLELNHTIQTTRQLSMSNLLHSQSNSRLIRSACRRSNCGGVLEDALFSWLLAAGAHVDLDSLLAAMQVNLTQQEKATDGGAPYFCWEIGTDGSVRSVPYRLSVNDARLQGLAKINVPGIVAGQDSDKRAALDGKRTELPSASQRGAGI
ncbi:MAG: hypothetical protein HY986_13465 [Candidatus Melainabacteria bacterium]|nr:hypothetical protein [Candidatus Melainabacteria bacterium]